MPPIHIEIREPDTDLLPFWRDLGGRAEGNAFLDPAGLKAVRDSGFAKPRLLLAWDAAAGPRKLVGVMALRSERTPGPFAPHLCGLPHGYAALSNPVVDPRHAAEVVPAMLAAIAADPGLSTVVRLEQLDAGDPTYDAILSALAERAAPYRVLGEHQRAFVTATSGIKPNGATRSKLRQKWNRLSAAGTVEIVNQRSPDAAAAALEVFLAMEAASWKSDRGTALLSNDRDAAFARAFIAAMAADGNASVALLRLDGRPIASLVLFYAGSTAYTWKVAYDAAYAWYSPGALLAEKLTEGFFLSGQITTIESCATEEGFLYRLWFGRRPTIDLLIELGPRMSLTFRAVALHVRGRAWVSALRRRLRAAYERVTRGKATRGRAAPGRTAKAEGEARPAAAWQAAEATKAGD